MREIIGGRGVLEGALALLEAFNEHGGQADLTQLVRSTVHRLDEPKASFTASHAVKDAFAPTRPCRT
ncbi:hypothetical protein [Amycolatopsis sp. cmx-11-51]|uniref:hypothetical protein n=1 Tax=Amycolatopsis sp. cmx-11-51 TaxID=2785797 RepID=UPI0039E30DFC